jgi:peptide/nickel transport system substrate-binding protein
VAAVAGTTLLALSFAALSPAGRGQEEVLVIGSEFAPENLDPALTIDSLARAIAYATCMRLVDYPDRDGPAGARLVPEAAAAMPRVSRDGRTYSFRVRPGLRFSDGSPLTAASFSYAFERLFEPAMQSVAARSHGADDIVGARAKAEGRARRIAGLTARGDRLTIRLTRPSYDLLPRLATAGACPLPVGFPVDPAGVQDAPLPGSGPYYVAEYERGSEIVLRRNPYYRGSRPRKSAEIRITIGRSSAELQDAVERGEIDLVPNDIFTTGLADLIDRYGVNGNRLFLKPSPATFYLVVNTRSPLFRGNPALRRAIGFALDRPALVRLGGPPSAARPSDQLLPSTLRGFVDSGIFPLDGPALATARRLARGNVRAGRALLYVGASPRGQATGRILQRDLGRIGLRVDVRAAARPVMLIRLALPTERWDLAVFSWFQDWADPGEFLIPILHGRSIPALAAWNDVFLSWNYSRFDDAGVNARLDAAARLEGEARLRAFARIEADVLRRHAPVIPLYQPNEVIFVSERTGCVVYNPAAAALSYGSLCRR